MNKEEVKALVKQVSFLASNEQENSLNHRVVTALEELLKIKELEEEKRITELFKSGLNGGY